MALTDTETKIGELGSQLAQAHYALTTDHEGALPMRSTDADRQELARMLGRAPTLEEDALFDAGYRESFLRLAYKGGPLDEAAKSAHPVLQAELFALVAKYGIEVPAEGTPEREQAKILFSKSIDELREKLGRLIPKRLEDLAKADEEARAKAPERLETAPKAPRAPSVPDL